MDDKESPGRTGEYVFPEAPPAGFLREAAPMLPEEPRLRVVTGPGKGQADHGGKGGRKVKTSVYLDRSDVDRLAWLAEIEERPQAEIIRDAIRAYKPPTKERRFHVFDTWEGDGRSIADIPDEELFRGFGADAWAYDVNDVGRPDR